MRLATFIHNGTEHPGIFHNGGHYPLGALMGEEAPESVLEFIRQYENKPLPDFTSKIEKTTPLAAQSLCAPIPSPFRNIICLGKNYKDHAKEIEETKLSSQGDDGIPSKPVYFSKNANPAVGHNCVVPLHSSFTKQVDYEVELAVVIGKKASNVTRDDVNDIIFGYTIINDVSARDIQTDYGQWYFGKSLEGFCPMGPYIVTKDEIPSPVSLNITCRVNGETRQNSNTSSLIYDIPLIICELSRGMCLYPGDIIATGTPGGIGHAKKPPVYLKNGDKVECEIEKIGVLANTFEDATMDTTKPYL